MIECPLRNPKKGKIKYILLKKNVFIAFILKSLAINGRATS